jgi:hypothetical protein
MTGSPDTVLHPHVSECVLAAGCRGDRSRGSAFVVSRLTGRDMGSSEAEIVDLL